MIYKCSFTWSQFRDASFTSFIPSYRKSFPWESHSIRRSKVLCSIYMVCPLTLLLTYCRLSFRSCLLAIKSIRGQQRALCQNCSNNCNLNEYGFKNFDNTQTVILQFGPEKEEFSPVMSPGLFSFLLGWAGTSHLLFSSFCSQTYRELDRTADSERRRYGTLYWTPETVSVDAVIWLGAWGRPLTDTSLFFSPTVFQIWKRTVEPVLLLIPVFRQVACHLTAERPMFFSSKEK